MFGRSRLIRLVVITVAISLAIPATAIGKGGGETTAVNNLSYPALAVDGFAITQLAEPAFVTTYTGTYPGLTADEITSMEANGPWYPQKLAENRWQADFENTGQVDVTYIDWSDNMESVFPKLRSPFRVEIVLFKALEVPMTGYRMGVLEYPSSSTELQGTNTATYENDYATVISGKPRLGIQYLGASVPADLSWSEDHWVTSDGSTPTQVTVGFAPELNVGGRYIFGASSGGWKPTQLGYYRLTFYVPTGSGVNLAAATIANEATGFSPPTEAVATAQLDGTNNLTWIDLLVKGGGGGGRK